MFISIFFIFISFSRATLFVKATTSITHLCKYVKEHRHTPFPFVDDAKVRTKKMRLKEFKRIMEVFRELWN